MGILTYLAIGLVLIIYIFINYYLGYKGASLLRVCKPGIRLYIYWIVFWSISMSFIFYQFLKRILPDIITKSLNIIGSYWLGVMLYLLMFYLVFEIINFGARKLGLWKRLSVENQVVTKYSGFVIIAMVTIIFAIGYINADRPFVKEYQVNIPKKTDKITELNVVMVSDLHIGSIGHDGLIKNMVNKINELKPDVVLFSGDIINDEINTFKDKNFANEFGRIKSKYGMYAVTGNHEYYGGDGDEFVELFEETGVNVLMDEVVKVADSFYIAGRIDKTSDSFSKVRRMGEPEFLKSLDSTLPIILMDHVPDNLNEAKNAGVDLQFSGHTHRGQIFPGNLLTKKVYEVDYGYMKKDNFQIIVSSGLGAWGTPIRLGSRTEIVSTKITFGG